MTDLTVILPPVSDDKVSTDLVYLTEVLMTTQDAETTGGFLGGEYGYGAYYENDTFMMHPFCWCERDDCLWCLGCSCEYTDADNWRDMVLIKQCDYCAGKVHRNPNFLHKPSGTRVEWYKYIGRGMEVTLNGDWTAIFNDTLASIGGAQ